MIVSRVLLVLGISAAVPVLAEPQIYIVDGKHTYPCFVKFRGDKVSSVDGSLTVKGITKPVTLTVISFKCMPHPLAKKDACGADATATIRRTEFNAGKYAPYVSDDVTLNIAVEAIRE